METKEMESKIKTWFSKSAKASKQAFEKAGDKVQDFTDKSVLKIEKKQLEGKREELYFEIGKKVSDLLKAGDKIACADENNQKAVDKIQREIVKLDKQIVEKEKEIKA